MSAELINTGAQQDLQHLMSLGQKKRARMIIDWLLGEDQGRKALAEELLLADKTGSAKLLVASALARWTKLSRRLQILAAITRLGLQVDIDEVFDLFISGRRLGEEFRSQAVLLVRNNHRDDDRAARLAAVPEDTKVPTTLPATAIVVLSDR